MARRKMSLIRPATMETILARRKERRKENKRAREMGRR
jgi:hypothetical protein